MSAVLDYLPKGNTLSDEVWHRRHVLLQWILALHIPALFLFAVLRGFTPSDTAEALALPLACLIIGHLMRSRRLAAAFVTLGLIYCSAALVGFSNGAIEAHFHFFIMIGFIALYQDWVPFLLDILFTVLSHGIGSSFVPNLMFNHASAQQHPWEWSLIHGVAVLAACVGVVVFWKNTEEEQQRSLTLTQQLAAAEIGRRRFTSELLVNLARRNQNLLYRQLELLNDLEDKERDADALADLFRLDHLATRIRRNAESLLVLSGEESPRTWREPVQLVDVIRAAIAEIEDLDRVDDAIDETLAVSGRSVADLTHLFAELLENAVHFSPPGVTVLVRSRPVPSSTGTHVVTIEDWGVGMTPGELADANETLRAPREVDLSVSQRLGLHVVARLAQRYGISVELTPTPGGGVTAVAVLPPAVFERAGELVGAAVAGRSGAAPDPVGGFESRPDDAGFGIDFGPADGSRPVDGRGRPAALNGSAAGGLATTPARSAAPAMRPGPAGPPPLPPDPAGRVGPLPRRDAADLLPRRGPGGPGGPGDPGDPGDSLPRPRLPESGTPTPSDGPTPDGARAGTNGAQPSTDASPAHAARPATDPGPARGAQPTTNEASAAANGAAANGAAANGAAANGAAVDRAAVDRAAVDRAAVDRAAVDRAAVDRAAVDRAAVDRAAVDRAAVDRAAVDRAAVDRAAVDRAAVDRAAVDRAAVDRAGRNGVGGDGDRPAADRGPARGGAVNGPAVAWRPEPFRGPTAGGDGATQPGRGSTGEGWSSWSSWWTRATPPDSNGPLAEPHPDPDPHQEPEPNGSTADPVPLPEPNGSTPDPVPLPEPNGSTPDPVPLPEPNGSTPDPVPLPEPRPPTDDSPQLRRRVPQANLAAGLRRDSELQPPEDPVVRDPLAARNALSRFQAAQRAARDAVEGERGDGGPTG